MVVLVFFFFNQFNEFRARTWGLENTGKSLGIGLNMTPWKVQLFEYLVRLIWMVICFVYTKSEAKLIDLKDMKLKEDGKSFMQHSI